MIHRIVNRLRRIWGRRHFHLSRFVPSELPVHNVSWVADGFTIRKLAGTGVVMVENFCTEQEAADVIEAARDHLKRSGVLIDGKFQDAPGRISDTARMFGPDSRNDVIYPLMLRASMLVGLPYTHLEDVYVTRYQEGGRYDEHIDFGDEFQVDRLYTVLLYLNTLPESQGGETVFPNLKVAVQPRVGRAVTWTNKNPDGSGHFEVSHAACLVKNGGEKWSIQFWFRRYPMLDPVAEVETLQARPGIRLTGWEELPEGVSIRE